MGSGNALLANIMRWAWDEIKAGRPETKSFTGKSATVMTEDCVRIIEEMVETSLDKDTAKE